MKVKNNFIKAFKPITLTITLESEEELSALFCVFNWYPMTSFLDKHLKCHDTTEIRDILGETHYMDLWDEMKEGLGKYKGR